MAEPEPTGAGRRRPEGCLLFDSGTLRFSKFISRQTLQTSRLLIPRSFARKHGKELSERVTFQVPGSSTTTWKVEVSKGDYDDNRLCFHNEGFRNFIDFYSLAPQYTLVFQYDGASLFSVFIFDDSGSEIHYPLKLDDVAGRVDKELRLHYPEMPRKRSRSDSYSPKRNSMAAARDSIRIDIDNHGGSSSRAPERLVSPISRSIDSSSGKQWSKERSSWKNWKPSSTSRAPKMKNPGFEVTLSKRCEYSAISIPPSFSELCIKNNPEILTLRVGNKSWMVNASKSKGSYSYRIYGGWLVFARENAVKEGDVCCFELMDKDDLVLNVSICNPNLVAN
ncbi:B3 domain-containing transcription factor VRN1 [Linum grandiflorum]